MILQIEMCCAVTTIRADAVHILQLMRVFWMINMNLIHFCRYSNSALNVLGEHLRLRLKTSTGYYVKVMNNTYITK